MNSERRF